MSTLKTSKYTHFEMEHTLHEHNNVEVVEDGNDFSHYSVYGRNQEGLAEHLADFPAENGYEAEHSAEHLVKMLNNSLI